ncbi:bifunctional DNA primase/polymerase [Nocardia sp. NBC_00881]|uniref:bifunctional DNA primase/polymerase n=1 Tax=Nocardia sp. NBC_00881 TaxID=2975995 RepID=UPI003864C0D9|nr:bifunctional DNA primase/polymerase [Nocardia sp. NBC_00881]
MTAVLDLRAVAFAAVARGWPVFPLRPGGKKPAIKCWPDLASTDEDRIHRWWGYNPRYNVAILTGSPAGLHVIDLDARHMTPPALDLTAALARLAEHLSEPAPPTLTIATPGGWHLFFRAPNDPPLRCTVARIGDGIDSRGHGGYIVAPGSRTPHGDYTIAENRPVADLPAMLIQRIIPPPAPTPPRGPTSSVAVHPDSYLAAILTGEAERVARARVHLRNHTLFRSALVLGRLVAADEVSEHDARTVLTTAAATHIGVEGFTAEEVHRTVSNAFRYSRARPRRLRP